MNEFKLVANDLLKNKTFKYVDDEDNSVFARIEKDNSGFVIKLRIKNDFDIVLEPVSFNYPFDFEGYDFKAKSIGEKVYDDEILKAFLTVNQDVCEKTTEVVKRMVLLTSALRALSISDLTTLANIIEKSNAYEIEDASKVEIADDIMYAILDSVSEFEEAKPLLNIYQFNKAKEKNEE